jgi:hypothetical protein
MALVNKEHLALCSGPQFAQLVGTICFVIEHVHPRHPHLPLSARLDLPRPGGGGETLP